MVVVAIAVALMKLQHGALVAVVVNTFMLLTTLKLGYVLALMLSNAWTRVGSRGSCKYLALDVI